MSAIDDQLAELLGKNADLYAAYDQWSAAQVMLLAGTVDDPASFNADGGKTGALGYYPVVNVSGQTIYVPCIARLRALALGGANAETLDALLATTGAKLAAVDAATVEAAAKAGEAATQAARAQGAADAIGDIGGARDAALGARIAADAAAARAGIEAARIDGALPYVETLDPEVLGRVNILDPAGRLVGVYPDPREQAAIAAAYRDGVVESLDPTVLGAVPLLDARGRVAAMLASGEALAALREPVDAALAQLPGKVGIGIVESLDPAVLAGLVLLDAAGRVLAQVGGGGAIAADTSAISKRIDYRHSARGDLLEPVYGAWLLRETRMRLRKRDMAEAVQHVITLIGDSLTDGPYWLPAFAKTLQDRYGMAGVGWVGFGWWGTAAGTWTDSAQPLGIAGCTRPDLVPLPTVIGTWTCRYNQGADSTPSLYRITSTTVGDQVRFTFPAGHASARLFYFGAAGSACRYSWDGGQSWNAQALETVGAANVALSAVPAAATSLLIEVTAGTVSLCGVDMQSAAPGVRIHKLGGSGAQSSAWAGVSGATWGAQLAALAPTAVVVGLQGNDKSGNVPPDTFLGRLTTIAANIEAAVPYADRLLTSRPENARTDNVYPMTDYTLRQRQLAVDRGWAHLDHAYYWGKVFQDYGVDHPVRPWLQSDLVHPVTLTGGRALADATLSLFLGL